MEIKGLLAILKKNSIKLYLEEDKLKYTAPKAVISSELLSLIQDHKLELVSMLSNTSSVAKNIPQLSKKTSKDSYELSFAQSRLWFLDQFEGSNENYNIPIILRLEGKLDIKALKKSLNQLIVRHASFRTVFTKDKTGVGVQKILDKLEINLVPEKLDVKSKSKDLEKAIKAEINKEISTPFDFVKGSLVRVRLFEVPDGSHCETTSKQPRAKYVFVFNHHIISDGVSVDIILKDLSEFYQANIEKREPKLDELPIQYVDFAAWQRVEFKKPEFQDKLKYWKDILCDYSDLQLPIDKSRPANFSYKGANFNFSLDKDLSAKLSKLAQDNGTTLYMVLLTAFNVLLSRYSGSDDIILGSPISNRYHHDLEGLVGFFVNTLILRNQVDSNKSVKELLNQISQDTLSAFDNQEVPFEKTVELLDITRDTSRNPIVQVIFSLQSFGDFGGDVSDEFVLKLPGVDIKPYQDVSYDVAKFDLSLFMRDAGDELAGNFNYCTDLFNQDTIERMVRNFERLLSAIVENSSTKVKDLRLLTDERRKQILIDWNDTAARFPKDKTIYQLFEEQVKKTPNNIAVIFEDDKLSYKDLNKKSNQLARLIRDKYKTQNKKDLKPDSLIGLCVERSLDMIIGILGILKAGGAYVPLDPDYPQDRLEYMIEDSHEGLIITQKDVVAKDGFLDKLHHDDLLVIDSEEVKAELSKQSDDNLEVISGPNNLAYVIYTSGSTGKPKGTMLEHRGVVNQLTWIKENHQYVHNDIFLNLTTYAFDASVRQIFVPLISGSSVVIPNSIEAKDIEAWTRLIMDHKVTRFYMVPTALRGFIDYLNDSDLNKEAFSKLSMIGCGGEALSSNLLRDVVTFFPKATLLNQYGPTEASANVMQWHASLEKLEKIYATPPIGKAIGNINLYVLGKSQEVLPIAVPGELYIGGIGLSRGYLNKKEITSERFISNPFAKELGLAESDRIYKTGDLVRWLPDGNIEYLGRTDFQVKIRGFRIELGEIENILAKNKIISQVTVIAKEKEGSKYLVAYYVIAKDKKAPEIDDLRSYLSETLPDYMVPAAFVKLDEMPLTPNGKINRRALPDPDMSLMGEEYVAPRNEIEQKLAEIWSDVLKLEQIGINDNFFSMGGDSIISIQLVSRARNSDIHFTPKDLFQNPTIAKLAKIDLKGVVIEAEQDLVIGGDVRLSPIQKHFFNRGYVNINYYNQSQFLQVSEFIDLDILEKALAILIHHHDSLRLRYQPKDKSYQQYYDDSKSAFNIKVKKIDLSNINSQEQTNKLTEHCNKVQASLDIKSGPVIAVALFTGLADRKGRLLIVIHHIIVDGISWRVIITDLKSCYHQIKKGEQVKLPPKTSSYKDWVKALIEYADNKAIEDLDYWLQISDSIKPLKQDFDCKQDYAINMSSVYISLDRSHTNDLLNKTQQAYNTEINDLLLSAFALALTKWQKTDSVSFNLEGHGREECVSGVDIIRTVGWFTSLFPVVLRLSKIKDLNKLTDADYKGCIRGVKEQLRNIPDKGLSYSALKYCSSDGEIQDKLTRGLPLEVNFNYLGQFSEDEKFQDKDFLGFVQDSFGFEGDVKNCHPYLLDLNGLVMNGKLGFYVKFSMDHFSEDSINKFSKLFKDYLLEIIEHCVAIKRNKEFALIVAVNEFGYKPPLFLVHGSGSGAQALLELSNNLGRNQPVYILESYNMYSGEKPIDNLSKLAGIYVEELLKIKEQGPFFLGGWSLGAVIAYEMSQQLISMGHEVLSIYILDQDPLLIVSGVNEQDIDEIIKKNVSGAISDDYKMRIKNDYRQANTMLLNYAMMKSKQNIVVFKASENILSFDDLGWSKYTEYVETHQINGDHFSIIKDDGAKEIADVIQDDIKGKIKSFKSTKKEKSK